MRGTGANTSATRAPEQSRLGHRPALDGLRAVAVAAVVLYHGDVSWLKGGYLGVDVFFVLSGFLITTLLLEEHAANGRISIRDFWLRRARRLLPALVVVMVGVALYAALIADSAGVSAVRGEAFATLGYVSNWHLIAGDQSYFAQFAGPTPLQHTWSLAIEEQFYLLWPILLPALWVVVRHRRRLLGMVIGTVAIASAVWMAVLHQPGTDPSRVYYGTDTRAFGLLLGAVLAVVLVGRSNVRSPRMRQALLAASAPALAVIVSAFVIADASADFMYEGGFLLIALATVVVVAAAIQPGANVLRRVLEHRPLQVIGRASYGVYLWHWPVFVAMTPARTGLRDGQLLLARIAVTAVFTTASYLLIEMPVRRGVFKARIKLIGPILAPALIAALLVSTASAASNGGHELGEARGPIGPDRAASARNAALERPGRLMIVGDSVAETLGWGFGDAAIQSGYGFWNRGTSGCGLADRGRVSRGRELTDVSPKCAGLFDQWRAAAAEFQPDVTVVLFDVYVVGDLEVDGQSLPFRTPESDAYLLARLDEGVRALSEHGGHVMLLTAPYNRHGDQVPGVAWEEDDRGRVDHYNDLLRSYVSEHPEVLIGDLNRFVCPNGQCVETVNGESTRWDDGVHFLAEAGKWVFGWLNPSLEDLRVSPDQGTQSSAAAFRSVTPGS